MFSGEYKQFKPIDYQKLFFIAATQGDLNLLKQSVESKKIDVNLKSPRGNATGLYLAVHGGHTDVVDYLLTQDAVDVNLACSSNGFTPLHAAARHGYEESVQSLLAVGANTHLKSHSGYTPLDVAIFNKQLKIGFQMDGAAQGFHSCLIQRMIALGFESSFEGVCLGFSEVVKLFALSGKKDLNKLYATISLLKKLKVKDLLLMQETQGRQPRIKNKALDDKQTVQQAQGTVAFKQSIEEQFLDVLVLLNGIELGYQGHNYQDLREEHKSLAQFQNSEWVTPMIQPLALEKKGGVVLLSMFSGVYNLPELIFYFTQLQICLSQTKDNDEPIVLDITSTVHALTVVYYPSEERWEFFEINGLLFEDNQFKVKELKNNEDVAKEAANGLFSKDTYVVFKTRVFTTKKAASYFESAIHLWRNKLTPILAVTPEKAICFDGAGASWLSLAAKDGDLPMIKELLSRGAEVNGKETKSFTIAPLYIATQSSNVEAIEFLLSHAEIKPNQKNQLGYTALHAAVHIGRMEVIKVFHRAKLEKGLLIDPNIAANDGTTPLSIALKKHRLGIVGYSEIINALLEMSARVDVTKRESSLLFESVCNEKYDLVKVFIECKADLNTAYKQGLTAAYVAAEGDMASILKLLADSGADLEKSTMSNWTPLHIAAWKNATGSLKVLVDPEYKINLEIQTEKKLTAVNVAAGKNNREALEILAKAGANLQHNSSNGTPLIIAVKNGNYDMILDLLAYQVNVLQQDDNHHTALYYALTMAFWDIAALLLKDIKLQHLNASDTELVEKHIEFLPVQEHCLNMQSSSNSTELKIFAKTNPSTSIGVIERRKSFREESDQRKFIKRRTDTPSPRKNSKNNFYYSPHR